MKNVLRSALVTSALLVAPVAQAHVGMLRTHAIHQTPDGAMIVVSNDGLFVRTGVGAPFRWVCMPALAGAEPGLFAPTVLSDEGTLVAAVLSRGLARGDALGCDWHEPETERYLVDLDAASDHIVTLSSDGDAENQLYETSDDGATLEPLGATFEAGFLTERVRVAPSDSQRVYVSGQFVDDGAAAEARGEGAMRGLVFVSSDGGVTFEEIPFPMIEGERVVQLVAVDPANADRVFVRVRALVEERLYVSTDGARTFVPMDVVPASPDPMDRPFAFDFMGEGDVLYGTPLSGLRRFDGEAVFTDVAPPFEAACIVVQGDEALVCGSGKNDGFMVGRASLANGKLGPIEPILTFADVDGVLQCGGNTNVASICEAQWPVMLVDLGRAPPPPPIEAPPTHPSRLAVPDRVMRASEAHGCEAAPGTPGSLAWALVALLPLLRGRRRRLP